MYVHIKTAGLFALLREEVSPLTVSRSSTELILHPDGGVRSKDYLSLPSDDELSSRDCFFFLDKVFRSIRIILAHTSGGMSGQGCPE